MSVIDSLMIIRNLETFFSEKTKLLKNFQEPTKAYITQVFSNAKKEKIDYSKESLTIIYAKARNEHRFDLFQNLGDWILFSRSLYPQNLNSASVDYYNAIAQDSYYKCYRIMNKKWIIFEELADRFPHIVNTLQVIFIEPDESNQDSSQSLLIQT